MQIYEKSNNLKTAIKNNTLSYLSLVGENDNLKIIDLESNDTLIDILKELKKINLHLSLLTDVNLQDSDLI
jgi:hypothetical protein